jgi:hypothetical protein
VRLSEAPLCNVTIEELFQAYYDCRKRKRNTPNALAFETRLERNLMDLYHELHAGLYRPGRSTCFAVTHPRPREIWAADFRDRIVHHLFYISADSCACIPGRGTLYAVDRLEHHLRSATQDWTQPRWVLQMDLANFFVSIDKQILDAQLARTIDHAYTLALARILLHHDPTARVRVRSSPALMRTIPPHKSLFNAHGRGLPIGNLTSQFLANVYLDPLDQYIKRELRQRYYVRYVDDLVIVGHPKQDAAALHALSQRLTVFALEALGVQFHPRKTHIQRADQGVNFVGYIIRPYARYMRRRTVATAMARLREALPNPTQTLNSYLGMLRHANGWRQRKALAQHALAHGLHVNRLLTKVVSA